MNQPRKTTRRQFLQGRSAAAALVDAIGAGDFPDESERVPQQAAQETFLLQIERDAMACQFAVFLAAEREGEAPDAAIAALDLVEQLEDQLSVFRSESEVSRINRRAFQETVSVEPGLHGLLTQAVRLHEETGGAFDITAAPLWKVWGFHRRAGSIPDAEALAQAAELVGSHHLQLDEADHTVRFLQEGMEINLGAIGKGYALDRSVELLLERGVENFLIHGGRSSIAARGSRQLNQNNSAGWTIGLRHPLRPETRLAEICLHDRALGTSSAATQSFYHQGQRYGHILDPRSGLPAEGLLSSTVLASSAAEADALATACYVMGLDAALDYCRQRGDLSAVFTIPGSRVGGVTTHLIGVPADDWQCLLSSEVVVHD